MTTSEGTTLTTESSGTWTSQNLTNATNSNATNTNATNGGTIEARVPAWLFFSLYPPCGYCDTRCVYRAIETCFTLGILANAVVLARVCRDKQLRNPTFVSIAACALADMCFLVVNLSRSFEVVILTVTCDYPYRVPGLAYLFLKSVTWFAANAHVALLAILRYFWLTFPLKANAYLSMRRVVMLSALVWVIALVLTGTLTSLIFFTGFSGGQSKEFNLVFWTMTYLMPLVTTVTLHVVKVYRVKRMTSETATEQTRKVLRTMSRMVMVVVTLATVLPFLYILNRCINSFFVDAYGGSITLATHVQGVANVLLFLNHSINPILYAFLSDAFRVSLKRMLGLGRNAADKNNTGTALRTSSLSEVQVPKQEIFLEVHGCVGS